MSDPITFPSTIPNPEYPLKVDHEDNSITSKFEDGTVQSRLKFTKSRKTFTLKWSSMAQADYDDLEEFIVNTVKHAALIFEWTNPTDNVTYNVRCTRFDAELKFVNFWDVEIELQEA